MPDLRVRRRCDERMDAPDLDPAEHRDALRGLARLNLLAGSARLSFQPIRRVARTTGRRLNVLDVACGAGDVALALWRRGRGLPHGLSVTGCDVSPTAVQHARERASAAGAPPKDLRFERADALAGPLPGDADVVTCSLFLHHLDEADATRLFQRLADAARGLVIVTDLRRSRVGLALAWLASRVATRSPVVHFDATASVRQAFTGAEALELARRAGLDATGTLELERVWPARFRLTWRRA